MTLKARLESLPLFWKTYIFIVALLAVVVTLAEGILEPLAEGILQGLNGGFRPWHEGVIWVVVLLVPSLACGYILSKALTAKLERMGKVSKALARGNLEARLPVQNNSRDAFDMLAQNFNEMASAIERQLHNERRLLADISHELRSPLTRMTIAAELLHRRRGEAEQAAAMLRLDKEVAHMNELVGLLLTQGRDRLSASGADGPVDVGAMLAELADDFTFQGEAQRKTVRTDIAGGLRVYGKAPPLQRMFGNLLSNALFYTPAGGAVGITAGREDGEVRVAIRDYGPGVPEEQLEDIFRAFYRVDSSRARSSGGVGLGLALAREAAIIHGGNIQAENAAPGLRVTVALPAWTAEQ